MFDVRTMITRGRWVGLAIVVLLGLGAATVFARSTGQDPTGAGAPMQPAGDTPITAQEEEPGHAGEEHTESEVHLTAAQSQSLGVAVAPVASGSASGTLRRPATVLFDRDRRAFVGPRVPSKVVRVLRDLGDRVAEGEGLAVLSSVELGRAKAEFLTARARESTRRAALERETRLREERISSEAEFLETRAAHREAAAALRASREALDLYGLTEADVEALDAGAVPLSHFTLRSPVAGVVQQRDLSPGQSVGPEETPIHVADVSRVWIMIDAFERDIPLLDDGLPVTLRVRSLPDHRFEGRTDWVSYELDEESRTLHVRALVPNPGGALRPGMFGTAAIRPTDVPELPMVPSGAVQQVDGESVVFVPGEEDGAYRAVPVRTGEEADGRIEVLAGLAPGDPVVVDGAFELMSALTAGSRSADHGH